VKPVTPGDDIERALFRKYAIALRLPGAALQHRRDRRAPEEAGAYRLPAGSGTGAN